MMDDERTTRLYFNTEITNQTNQNVLAKSDIILQKPLFRNPQQFDLCINRFRLPLNGIPLTRDNIPFQQWQVALGFNTDGIWNYETAYVPQYNPQSQTQQNIYCLNSNVENETVSSLNPYTITSTTPLANGTYGGNNAIQPASDTAYNTTTFYVLSNDILSVEIYQNNSGTPIGSFIHPAPPTGQTFFAIEALATNNAGDFFMGYMCLDDNNLKSPFVQRYTRTGANTWAPSNNFSYPSFSSDAIYFETLMALDNQVIGYFNQQAEASNYIIWFTDSTPTVYGGATTSQFESIADSNYYYRSDNAGNYSVATTGAWVLQTTGIYVRRFLGFDASGYVLVYRVDASGNPIGYQALDNTTGNTMYSFTPPNGCFRISIGQPSVIPSDAGEYLLWSYQDYLTQINSALATCYTNIKAKIPTYAIADPPKIFYNAQNKLFYLQADNAYLDSTTYTIDMNQILYNMFLFPSIQDNNLNGYKSILIQDTTGTAPNTLQIYQESSSIAKFYDLVRILVQTTRLPVNGDQENSNQSQLVITDVVPDTTTLSPSGLLIYQPTVLRFYSLYSTTPLTSIDLYFSYGTKKGNIHPVYLTPGEYASVKLQFSSNPLNNN
jgi:hypothetical protein